MKSQKGITLSSLIVYVITLLIALSVLATVRLNFQSNLHELQLETTNVFEADKVNLFLLRETKKADAVINNIDEANRHYVEFNNGNQYKYIPSDKAIYLCNSEHIVQIAENISSCTFSSDKSVIGKEILEVNIEVMVSSDETKSFNYEYTLNK